MKYNLATLSISLAYMVAFATPLVVPMVGRIDYYCALFIFTIQVESTSVTLS